MENDQFRDMLIGGRVSELMASLSPDETWTCHVDGMPGFNGQPYHVEAYRFGTLLVTVDSDGDLQAVRHHSVDCAQTWTNNAMTSVASVCAHGRLYGVQTTPVFTHELGTGAVDQAMATVTIPDDLSGLA